MSLIPFAPFEVRNSRFEIRDSDFPERGRARHGESVLRRRRKRL